MCQASKLNATDDVDFIVKVGDEVEIGDPLIVFGLGDTGDKAVDNFLKAFQSSENILDTAKRTIKSKHAGRVVEIRMYTVKSMDKLSPSLFDILDKHFKENIEKRKTLDKHDKSDAVYKLGTLYSLPTAPLRGPTIKGVNCDVLIEIYIEHSDSVSVGDKCVVYAASKQVISEVVPEGLEPYAESTPDEEISMFVSPRSILGRMIPSMLVTASANKILIELKKKVRQLWQS
jgi:DNA-directed RNA polymerase beta subunit